MTRVSSRDSEGGETEDFLVFRVAISWFDDAERQPVIWIKVRLCNQVDI